MDKASVSTVGVVLMVGITVALAAVIGVVALNMGGDALKQPPQGDLVMDASPQEDRVSLTPASFQRADKLIVQKSDGTVVHEFTESESTETKYYHGTDGEQITLQVIAEKNGRKVLIKQTQFSL